MNTVHLKHHIAIAAVLAVLTTPVMAQTSIFNDSFSDGARSGVSNTTGLTWFSGAGASILTATTGQMVFTNTSSGSRQFSAYFAPADDRVQLANIGDSLLLSATFSVSATNTASSASDFRFGLFDSTLGASTTRYTADNQDSSTNVTYGGYAMLANLGTDEGVFGIRERLTNSSNKLISTTGPFSASLATVTSQALTINSSYTATLKLTRTEEGVEIVASMIGAGLSDYTVSFLDTTTPYYYFDTVAFGGQFAAGENFTFTNISLTAIPEPSTYAALLGALALGLVAWRRRQAAI